MKIKFIEHLRDWKRIKKCGKEKLNMEKNTPDRSRIEKRLNSVFIEEFETTTCLKWVNRFHPKSQSVRGAIPFHFVSPCQRAKGYKTRFEIYQFTGYMFEDAQAIRPTPRYAIW